MGVILNRPIGQALGEMDDQFKGGSFSDVPVFEGGPVENEKLIVAAWEWLSHLIPSSYTLESIWKRPSLSNLKTNKYKSLASSGIQVGRLGSWRMNWMKRLGLFPRWTTIFFKK